MHSGDDAAIRFADEQLALQEEAMGDQNEMAGLHAVPSAGQGYMLITDRFGRAQLDQDAAFICTRIQFVGVHTSDFGANGFRRVNQIGFSVRDAGASVLVTISKWKQGLSNLTTAPVTNDVSESQFACVAQLVPQSRDFDTPLGQVDYVYTLSARWMVPRGSAIITALTELPGDGTDPQGAVIRQYRPQILFIGRKVYG